MKKQDAFYTLSYGLYLVSCAFEDQRNGYIANTVFQISANPPKFAISCHKENYSASLIARGAAFSISVLQQDTPIEFIQRFGYQSGLKQPKFMQMNFKKGITGTPIVYDYTMAWFECSVSQQVDVGTHWLFIGDVVDYGMLSSTETPLDYAWYRQHYKAASPPKAPTYVDEGNAPLSGNDTGGYLCAICDYVYKPAKGDPGTGIAPGTPFDDLPDDWVCPICGAGKMVFTETSGSGY